MPTGAGSLDAIGLLAAGRACVGVGIPIRTAFTAIWLSLPTEDELEGGSGPVGLTFVATRFRDRGFLGGGALERPGAASCDTRTLLAPPFNGAAEMGN